MRHWRVLLFRKGRITREWSVWADKLQIGANVESDVVIAPPFLEKAAIIGSDGRWECFDASGESRQGAIPVGQQSIRFEWGDLAIEAVDDTPIRGAMWIRAKERMVLASKMLWKEPGTDKTKARLITLASFAFIGLVSMTGMVLIKSGPKVENDTELPDAIVELVQQQEEKKEEEPPPPPEPTEAGGASDEPPKNPNEGGSTELRTVAWPPNSPSEVMSESVMDKINTMSDGLLGEDVDATPENAIDVILAGGGGSLKKGDRGGRGASGNGDRMSAMGGIGFGTGGRAGFGTGNGGTKMGDKMRLGAGGNGKGVATRGSIAAPKPTDIELGGEQGTRSPESILRVIRAHIGGFRYSYNKALRDNPNLGGKISLKFTISPPGDVIAISIVESNTGNSGLDEEIKDKARRMKFDAIEKGNVTVTYAFVLDKQ